MIPSGLDPSEGRGVYAARVSYVISPDARIIATTSDPGAQRHIDEAMKAVRAWKAAQKS